MVTYRLWSLLAAPPRKHPLFRRASALRAVPVWWRQIRHVVSVVAPLAYLVGGMLVCCAATSRALGVFILFTAVLLVLFNGTIYALMWSILIALGIASERESNEWELLCLLPNGALGAAWALATGCMSRENAFQQRYQRHVGILRVLVVIVAVVSLGGLLSPNTVFSAETFLVIVTILAAGIVSYLDYVQSVVLGAVVGIYAGLSARSRLDTQLWAFFLFLTLQVGSYALALVGGFVVLPALLPPAENNPLSALAVLALRVVLFALIREAVIALLWRLVAARLNTDGAQMAGLKEIHLTPRSPLHLAREVE